MPKVLPREDSMTLANSFMEGYGGLFIFVFSCSGFVFLGRGLLVLCFHCFSAFLLFLLLCFSCFSAFLLFLLLCFSCFSAFLLFLLLTAPGAPAVNTLPDINTIDSLVTHELSQDRLLHLAIALRELSRAPDPYVYSEPYPPLLRTFCSASHSSKKSPPGGVCVWNI